MDLQDPTSKMSKSATTDSGIIYMLDDSKSIEKKFKRAVTDSENVVRFDREKAPGVANLLEILAAATNNTPENLVSQYEQYGPLKNDAAQAVIAMLEPIRNRYHELINDKGELMRLLAVGNDRARNVAAATLARAHSAIGLLPRA